MTIPESLAKQRDILARDLLNEPLICGSKYIQEVQAGFKLGFNACYSLAIAERDKQILDLLNDYEAPISVERAEQLSHWLKEKLKKQDGKVWVK